MASIENATPPGMPVANIIEQQELARNASEAQLIEYAKSPRPDVIPPYLVTSELMRRKTVREKAAKAPQFTVAQEAVQQAEQGIMNQMQLQAPKMPPGGAVPGREQITREQIIEKGIAPLPNPGQPSMTGFAEGGIIGFAAGGNEGLYSGRGGYMPQVKGKNALQELTFRDPVNPRTRPGLYQDYNLNQGPGMSMEDYQAQTEAILGPDRSERISTLQEEFVTPFDEQINIIDSKITELGYGQKDPMTGLEIPASSMLAAQRPEDAAKLQDLQNQKVGLEQQRELYFEEASDPQVKQRMEQFQAEVAASSPDALNSEAGIKPLQPSQPGPQLPDFSGLAGETKGDGSIFPPYTRLDAGEEAAGALGYFKEQLGEDPNRAAQVARLAEIEAKGLERSARDRKMNISSALFKAADAFNKPGAYGAQIGSALAAGGQEYVTGANAISDREEKLDDKLFTLNNAMAQADRAEKVAAAKFGANSYQAAQAYNRKLEIQERADRLKSQQIEATSANTLALARFQRQISEDNKDDAAKVGKIKRELEDKIRKEPTDYGISSTEIPFLNLEEKASNSDERNAKIRAVKQKLEDIIARKTLEDGEIQALGGRLPNSAGSSTSGMTQVGNAPDGKPIYQDANGNTFVGS
ncbi:hypothetical protein N9F47_03970 [Gammaproteobacteria bacterium]|nr:hypothetical protein [Gammaproteobacteria bacterium]